jgi:hypothetical protein
MPGTKSARWTKPRGSAHTMKSFANTFQSLDISFTIPPFRDAAGNVNGFPRYAFPNALLTNRGLVIDPSGWCLGRMAASVAHEVNNPPGNPQSLVKESCAKANSRRTFAITPLMEPASLPSCRTAVTRWPTSCAKCRHQGAYFLQVSAVSRPCPPMHASPTTSAPTAS